MNTFQKSMDEPDFVPRMRPSSTTLGFATPNYVPISQFSKDRTSELVTVNLIRKPNGFGFRLLGGAEVGKQEEGSFHFFADEYTAHCRTDRCWGSGFRRRKDAGGRRNC